MPVEPNREHLLFNLGEQLFDPVSTTSLVWRPTSDSSKAQQHRGA